MAFPVISYRATNTELDPKLQDLLEVKFSSLEKYIGEETDVKCQVEFEKETASQSGDIFKIEANLWLHGKMYRAAASMDSFEKSVDEVRAELDKELRRAHKKRNGLVRRGGRALKSMMRFGKE